MICAPLAGGLTEEVLRELTTILPKKPDVIEWRVDYFRNTGNLPEVIEVAKHIKEAAGEIPIEELRAVLGTMRASVSGR